MFFDTNGLMDSLKQFCVILCNSSKKNPVATMYSGAPLKLDKADFTL